MERVIAHIDMDSFYAAVEQVRLFGHPDPAVPIEDLPPLVVLQWGGVLAANTAAKRCGITRLSNIKQARELCPEVRAVHVEIIGDQNKDGGKVSLARYREASYKIFQIFQEFVDVAFIERASVDEAFLDLTPLVDAEMARTEQPPQGWDPSQQPRWHVVGGHLDPGQSQLDARLLAGARIAARMRQRVLTDLGYTCSAGIAGNKLLAKLASAMNKPNQQTLVPPRAVPQLLEDLPLGKLRGLGGKKGAQLKAGGAATCGDIQRMPEHELRALVGERTAAWVFDMARGRCSEPVRPRDRPQSITAFKQFKATSDRATLLKWVRTMAEEIAERCVADRERYDRSTQTLTLSFLKSGGPCRSKSCAMPHRVEPATLFAEGERMLLAALADTVPCSGIGLAASKFVDRSNTSSLDRFLVSGAAPDFSVSGPAAAASSAAPAASAASAAPAAPGESPPRSLDRFLVSGAAPDFSVSGPAAAASSAAPAESPPRSLDRYLVSGAAPDFSAPPREDKKPPARKKRPLEVLFGSAPGSSSAGKRIAVPVPAASDEEEYAVAAEDLTPCPICSQLVPADNTELNRHVDECLNSGALEPTPPEEPPAKARALGIAGYFQGR